MTPPLSPVIPATPTEGLLSDALELCTDAVAILDWPTGDVTRKNGAMDRLATSLGATVEELGREFLRRVVEGEGPLEAPLKGVFSVAGGRELPFEAVISQAGEQRNLVLCLHAPEPLGPQTNDQITRDVVTDLPDRRSLEQALSGRFSEASGPFALLFVDLNGFKQVNDSLGHVAGDKTLREVARRFRDALRDADLVARYGGDEFVVLADGVESEEDAEPIVARLQMAVAEPIAEAKGRAVSASIGVAFSSDDYQSAEAMLHAADRRMYLSKHAES